MEIIYCKNCQHYEEGPKLYLHYCKHPDIVTQGHNFNGEWKTYGECEKLNCHNDCKLYEKQEDFSIVKYIKNLFTPR